MSIRFDVQTAFKEWAAVCQALAAGRQTILLRKGGIHEGREGFRVQHSEFFLYPTNFHQAAESLTPDGAEYVQRALGVAEADHNSTNFPKRVPLRWIASVAEVHELTTEADALRLSGLHIWSEATVRARFAYRRPGLFLLVVRVFAVPQPVVVTESAEMAGCKSWVPLPRSIEVDDARPVLSAEQFAAQLAAIHQALAG